MLKLIRITFYSMLFLYLLDIFDLFQTKIGFLKIVICCGMLLLPIPLLILEFKANRSLTGSILRKGIPILTIIGLLYLNPIILFFNAATWKTQTVKLINENRTSHKVEFQMKDIGAFGYSKRTCEVQYFSKYFYFVVTRQYDDKNISGHKWKKVNQDINEMGLK